MRIKLAVPVMLLCVIGPGCQLAMNATRNWSNEIHQCVDLHSERVRNQRFANEAWGQVVRSQPGAGHSADYAHGFKAGFADFLEAGGTGEPPALPPRHYWQARYQTPQGYRAIEDWFAGFRHGASVAQASGARQWVTVPVAAPESGPVPLPPPPPPPVVAPAVIPVPKKATEMLPEPREVKPGTKEATPEKQPAPVVPKEQPPLPQSRAPEPQPETRPAPVSLPELPAIPEPGTVLPELPLTLPLEPAKRPPESLPPAVPPMPESPSAPASSVAPGAEEVLELPLEAQTAPPPANVPEELPELAPEKEPPPPPPPPARMLPAFADPTSPAEEPPNGDPGDPAENVASPALGRPESR